LFGEQRLSTPAPLIFRWRSSCEKSKGQKLLSEVSFGKDVSQHCRPCHVGWRVATHGRNGEPGRGRAMDQLKVGFLHHAVRRERDLSSDSSYRRMENAT